MLRIVKFKKKKLNKYKNISSFTNNKDKADFFLLKIIFSELPLKDFIDVTVYGFFLITNDNILYKR